MSCFFLLFLVWLLGDFKLNMWLSYFYWTRLLKAIWIAFSTLVSSLREGAITFVLHYLSSNFSLHFIPPCAISRGALWVTTNEIRETYWKSLPLCPLLCFRIQRTMITKCPYCRLGFLSPIPSHVQRNLDEPYTSRMGFPMKIKHNFVLSLVYSVIHSFMYSFCITTIYWVTILYLVSGYKEFKDEPDECLLLILFQKHTSLCPCFSYWPPQAAWHNEKALPKGTWNQEARI